MSGITATGFEKKTLAEIKSEWEAAFVSAFGKSINLRPPSLMATVVGIASDREASLWDLAEESWNARGRSTSQGVSLDNANELTNEERLAAVASVVSTQLFFGSVGTVIDSTFIASVSGNSVAKFSPASSVTLIAGTNEVQLLSFSATPDAGTWKITMNDGQQTGSLAYNANATAVQIAIRLLAGWEGVVVTGNYSIGFTLTYGGTSGLQPQALVTAQSSITHTATPVVITPSETTLGVAQAVVKMVAKSTGPVIADALTLTVIETPVTGLTRTFNKVDAVVGRNVETDAEYRIRSDSDLQSSSAATLEAIRDKLKKVDGVKEAIVYENIGLTTDGNGVPGKTIHAYVDGGTNQDVADALWAAVGGGISTYGAVNVNVTDSQGLTQVLNFDRPTQKPVYVIVTITKDSTYPSTGDTDVKNALVAYGALLKIGDDVLLYPKLLPKIVDNVVGITDITVKIGFSPVPTLSANLVIAANERATFSTTNMTVTSS